MLLTEICEVLLAKILRWTCMILRDHPFQGGFVGVTLLHNSF